MRTARQMPRVRTIALGLLALALATGAAVLPLSAQGKTPLDAYKAYLDAASKATSPTPSSRSSPRNTRACSRTRRRPRSRRCSR